MRKQFVLIGLILLIAFTARLYKFSEPLADWHSWRQSDTSAVSRNFVQNGFDFLYPRYNDISKIQSGIDNPQGYRMVEFPVYNLIQAGGYVVFDTFSIEQWGRLTTILFNLSGILFLYLLVRKHADETAALFSALFYAILPFSIYFGRVVLPDTAMISMVLGAIYFFDRWISESAKVKMQNSTVQFTVNNYFFLFLATLFTASALLLKPFAVFFTVPLLYLAWRQFGFAIVKQWQLWAFLILSLLPLVLWRYWIQQFPEGIPVSDWLFNGGNIRFKGAYFYWIYADRIGRLILGYWGIALFIIGILVTSGSSIFKKQGWFFYSFLASSLLYLIIVARGNVQHDYYQIPIVPSLVIFLGMGASALFSPPKEFIDSRISRAVLCVCIIFMLLFGWYFVRDYFNINNRAMVAAGKAADEILPGDARVIAPYGGDTTLLYHVNRQGWPVFDKSIEEFLTAGANYMVIVNPTESDREGFGTQFEVLRSSPEYLILKLQ